MIQRTLIADFNAANPLYAGAVVTVYGVTAGGAKDMGNVVTLYAGIGGVAVLANPAKLDAEGKWQYPPYVDQPVILEISGPHVGNHDTGAIRPALDTSDVTEAAIHAAGAAGSTAMAQDAARKARAYAAQVDPQQIALIAQSFG